MGLWRAVMSRGRRWPERPADLWQHPRHVFPAAHHVAREADAEVSQ